MSGRSAHVRKKINTEATKDGKSASRSRAKSAASHDRDDVTISDFPMPGNSLPVGTGVGTTNARFLKFSEPARDMDHGSDLRNISTMSISSGGSGASAERRDQHDYGYRGPRRPNLKTEDVSGIEKSGFRNILDKKSDDVRKGLAKTFTFRRKDKEERRSSVDQSSEHRPNSVATVRPQAYSGNNEPEPRVYEGIIGSGPYAPGPEQPAPWEGPTAMVPPPTSKLPPIPPPTMAPAIRRWIGGGRPVQRWNKLRKDPELWDPNGDVLIFFGHKGQTPRPNPSFRLSSHIIEATESRQLITMLREGSTEEDIYLPPSPLGAPPMLRFDGRRGGQATGRGGHPTPPVSEDNSFGEADGQISYEMYFPTPSNMNKTDQLRHHITTRNVFALLYHASIVGITLCQALTDLHIRLNAYLPADADNVSTIIKYLTARGIDDVRNDAETAVGLLAWSEGADVRWEDGWKESFPHCAGMYNQLEECADFKSLTPITRALLERACLETQLRVQAAEERLVDLQIHDMWPTSGPLAQSPAKAAADRLQKFLLGHYTRIYGCWPPPPQQQEEEDDEDMWLTRGVTQALQRDFGALYDYLVNRDIVWDGSEARAGRKWIMVSESGNRGFDADDAELPMTDILVEFDNRMRFPRIPHPYPLVPESIPPTGGGGGGREGSSSMFKSSRKSTASTSRGGALERRVQLAYTEATNIYILGSEFTQSDLIDGFVKFEKTDAVGEVDPAVARRGRWVLVYGILQILASISVDAPGVRYRDDVTYHLSVRLRGAKVPPWKGASGSTSQVRSMEEAAHELSHCWIAPRTWKGEDDGGPPSSSGAESEGGSDNMSPVTANGHFIGIGRAWGHAPGRATQDKGHHGMGRSPQSYAGGYSSGPSVTSESDGGMSRASSRMGSRYGGGGPSSAGSQYDRGGDVEPPSRSRRRDHGDGGAGRSSLAVMSGGSGRDEYGMSSGRSPRIRDFDLDVIDDAEP
ncbi:hypothetical protein VdG2_09568 [Verticillium dahliae VDG2]|nr:hypothetical protein VdG2_09568 [Verticillium dahliae VDG2]